MIDRRTFLLGAGAMLLAGGPALAKPFTLNPKYAPTQVAYRGYPGGTIVIDTRNHYLFHVYANGYATRYGVGVGRAGLSLKGRAVVGRKAEWPSWRPTDNMIKRQPQRYAKYKGGMPGGPRNPLGARALYLYRNGQDTMYRIHGTTEPWSIGQSVSNGCIRMINDHVIQLYSSVPVGTPVVVL